VFLTCKLIILNPTFTTQQFYSNKRKRKYHSQPHRLPYKSRPHLRSFEHVIQVKINLDVLFVGVGGEDSFEGVEVAVCRPGDDVGLDDGGRVEGVEPGLGCSYVDWMR